MNPIQPHDFVTQQLTDLGNELSDSFKKTIGGGAVIPETIFVDVYLPLFAGDDNLKYPVTPHMWMNLAHGPFNEVTVVNSANEFLFNVPALCSQDAIKPIDGSGKAAKLPSVSDMITQARLYANRGTGVVQNIISEELNRRSFLFSDAGMSMENIQRWNEIFARYNRPLLPIKPLVTTDTPANANNIARDSQAFDDL